MTTGPAPTTILEQYKSYMGDLGNIGSRYATAQAFYASIVSGLFAVLAIKERTTTITDYLSWMTAVICCFIIAICWLWYHTLMYYDGLFAVKFSILKEMEKEGQLFKIYDPEYQRLEAKPNTKGGLIKKESLFPLGLGVVAAVVALAAAFHSLFF
jgi:hypothetical protein